MEGRKVRDGWVGGWASQREDGRSTCCRAGQLDRPRSSLTSQMCDEVDLSHCGISYHDSVSFVVRSMTLKFKEASSEQCCVPYNAGRLRWALSRCVHSHHSW